MGAMLLPRGQPVKFFLQAFVQRSQTRFEMLGLDFLLQYLLVYYVLMTRHPIFFHHCLRGLVVHMHAHIFCTFIWLI